MKKFSADHKDVLDNILLPKNTVRAGKMFGYPAYYALKKLCICLYEDGVGIKIPEASATRLLKNDPNVIPFQPMGKPKMREWVQINLEESEGYRKYEHVFDESIQYLLELQGVEK